MKDLVSIIIATRNSAEFLENCLKSIRNQTYKDIELIVVDGKSIDKTIDIAKKYKSKIYTFVPKLKKGSFDASYKRNYGAKKAKGEYVYWVDADMELSKKVIEEAVTICKKRKDAVIVREDSFGQGIWARAKNLERRCYWGDNTVESPRFYKHSVWDAIGGFDESLGAGGDDFDLHMKLLEKGYQVGRTKNVVMHNEGNLELSKIFKKHFLYGRDVMKYIRKRPKASLVSYSPIRLAYIRNIKLLLSRPFDTCVFIFMRIVENFAGVLGIAHSFLT